ncbi:hypothetical protein CY34DRAFT_572356 [Suillus luteus UH-Slu-Lm8-n1]|uniref:Uncharacterized protein n=1 Tax=Suillus luteus UH-Slu-Lm8-n1 TaxID=930992 RepID=A0A0D0BPE7_9AGAM|nr:hypothetical protein CY34DRAFT_572356 [Suillus luteus UH-Slu-Lm8-n1]
MTMRAAEDTHLECFLFKSSAHTQTHFHRFAILVPVDLQPASPYPAADFHPNSISLSTPSTAFSS